MADKKISEFPVDTALSGDLLPVVRGNDNLAVTADTIADLVRDELSSTVPGKGASLVSLENGQTVQDVLDGSAPSSAATAADIIPVARGGANYAVTADSLGAAVGFTQSGTGAVARTMQDKAREVVSITDFGAVGNGLADDSDAYRAASDALGSDGGEIFFPAGTYLIDYEQIASNRHHVGEGAKSIIKPLTTETRAALTADSGSPGAYVENVSFRHLRFESMVAPTFAEQKHLITLNGTSGWVFEYCDFVGWRGDAIYIGSSDTGLTERHNRNIRVVRCNFDGVNNNNRQAISAIDVDGLWVLGCTFANCTKSNMPGVIDLEPDAKSFHVIKNVWIIGNRFENCGGNTGTVAVFIPINTIAVPTNIFVEENVSVGSVQATGAGFFTMLTSYAITDTSVDSHVRVRGNRANGGGGQGRGLWLRGVRGVVSEGNTWEDFAPAGVLMGQTNAVRDVVIRDTFRRCGSQATTPRGGEIYSADYVDFTGSTFDDCGDGSASASALNFKTGTSSYVNLNAITITSPTSKTTRAVVKDAGHTFTAATNQHYGCQWGALANAFEAHESDSIWTAYTPVAEGTSTAGAGTYTRQYGRWRRIGRQVFFEIEIVQTAHTGTGMLQLSLPVQVALSLNNELRPVAVMLDGVSTTGGQVGAINPAAVVGGVTGAIRCYHTGTGTLAQTLVPAVAATFRASGTYMGQ